MERGRTFKSARQRRVEIQKRRRAREARRRRSEPASLPSETPPGVVPVEEERLAPYRSYGAPDFVMRGYYLDRRFRCARCGADESWTAAQQKWWYEVAKGFVYSTAVLCRACRRAEQARKNEARRAQAEGLVRKAQRTARRP